jgi:hypothetical protein
MKRILIFIAFLPFTSFALAQSGMYCHREDPSDWHIFEICEFSDGSAHTYESVDDSSWSHWFTSGQWKIEKARLARKAEKDAEKVVENERHVAQEMERRENEKAKDKAKHAQECKTYAGKPSYAMPYYCDATPKAPVLGMVN